MATRVVHTIHLITITFLEQYSGELIMHRCLLVELLDPIEVLPATILGLSWYESQPRLHLIYVHHFSLVVLKLGLGAEELLLLERFDELKGPVSIAAYSEVFSSAIQLLEWFSLEDIGYPL